MSQALDRSECTSADEQCDCLGCRIADLVEEESHKVTPRELLDSLATVIGRIISETDDNIVVRPSMLTPETQTVHKADVKSRELSKISPMPPGLLNMLSKQEILDLLAYLEAGGRADGAPFKK